MRGDASERPRIPQPHGGVYGSSRGISRPKVPGASRMRAPVGVDIDAGYDVRAAEVDVPMRANVCPAL